MPLSQPMALFPNKAISLNPGPNITPRGTILLIPKTTNVSPYTPCFPLPSTTLYTLGTTEIPYMVNVSRHPKKSLGGSPTVHPNTPWTPI